MPKAMLAEETNSLTAAASTYGRPCPPYSGSPAEADPAAGGEIAVGLRETRRRGDAAVGVAGAALDVADAVERLEHLLAELRALAEDGLDHVGRRVGETGQVGVARRRPEPRRAGTGFRRPGPCRPSLPHSVPQVAEAGHSGEFVKPCYQSLPAGASVNPLFTMFDELSVVHGRAPIHFCEPPWRNPLDFASRGIAARGRA